MKRFNSMKCCNRRRGFTLIQLLLTMSVAVVIMMVNVGWIHQTMKFASRMDQRQQTHQTLTRLAWDLRDDVHHSSSLSMDGEDRLVLELNDGTVVTYSISGTSLDLERNRDDETIQREAFIVSPDSQIDWDTSELPDWISLIVTRGPTGLASHGAEETELRSDESKTMAVDLHVRASANRWKTTFSKKESAKKESAKKESAKKGPAKAGKVE